MARRQQIEESLDKPELDVLGLLDQVKTEELLAVVEDDCYAEVLVRFREHSIQAEFLKGAEKLSVGKLNKINRAVMIELTRYRRAARKGLEQ